VVTAHLGVVGAHITITSIASIAAKDTTTHKQLSSS